MSAKMPDIFASIVRAILGLHLTYINTASCRCQAAVTDGMAAYESVLKSEFEKLDQTRSTTMILACIIAC